MKERNEKINAQQQSLSPMSAEDLPEVLRLERASFGQMAWTERDFRSAMASDCDDPLVLHADLRKEAEEKSVGGAAEVRGNEETAADETDSCGVAAYAVLRVLAPEAEIENICVAPECRGSGMGARLMREMLDMAKEKGAARVFLEVRAHNEAAKALYRKMGFSESYVRKSYYRSPTDDAIIMMKEIGNA